MNKKPSLNVKCAANAYAAPNERIAEFSCNKRGGLIALRETDGGLRVDIYRTDPGVSVTTDTTKDLHERIQAAVARCDSLQAKSAETGKAEGQRSLSDQRDQLLLLLKEVATPAAPIVAATTVEKTAIEFARMHYAEPSSNDIEIDDEPKTSMGDDGVWVAAWVWVDNSDAGKSS